MTNHLDPHEQNRRSMYLRALARLDGRNRPDHPHYGTFTGLYMARIRQLVAADMARLIDGARRPKPPGAWREEGGMTTPTEHTQLLRELADTIPRHIDGSEPDVCIRARQAAEEIEGRRGVVPTDDDLIREAIDAGLAFQPRAEYDEVYLPFDSDEPLDDVIVAYGRRVLARFSGGEVK